MKKLLMVALVLLISIAFVSTGFAQPKAAPEKTPSPKKQASKPRAEDSGFMGKVAMIDATMIAVKGKKATVTFDARNPKLKGYKAIGDVMVGDTVTAKYTKDSVMITKVAGAKPEKPAKEKPKTEMKEKPKEGREEGSSKEKRAKASLGRREEGGTFKEGTNGNSYPSNQLHGKKPLHSLCGQADRSRDCLRGRLRTQGYQQKQ